VNETPVAVLYAEDDDNDAFFMKRAFAKAGLSEKLVIVPDGRQAVNYVLGRESFVNRARPAFVLLDLKMPILNGLEALREIRSSDIGRKLPIAILTSSTQELDIAAAHADRANGYFSKPSNANELVGLLKSLSTAIAQNTAVQRLDIKGNQLPASKH
jgi:CheY-like chemotaxis protein